MGVELGMISLSQGQQTTNLMLEKDQQMQDSEAILDCAQPTMMDLEIRQQTVGSLNNIHCFSPIEDNERQLHTAVVRENNEGSVPNETVSIQAQDENFYELFKDFDFLDSTNTSPNEIALDSDSDWFRPMLQDFEECLEKQEETIPPRQQRITLDGILLYQSIQLPSK